MYATLDVSTIPNPSKRKLQAILAYQESKKRRNRSDESVEVCVPSQRCDKPSIVCSDAGRSQQSVLLRSPGVRASSARVSSARADDIILLEVEL